ncbi:MAG TPA: ribonuclease III [Vitreimonas sp.]|nr:ribonuclease III [Vitreimonas sp.]
MIPHFRNQALLITALTHRSALNEKLSTSEESNERLEFLGDAVLELATTQYLYHHFPQDPEGVLTAYRSALVKTTTLAEAALELGLGEQLYMSKGEEATGGRQNVSLLADTIEAIIGALYLDQGFEAAYEFLQDHLFPKFIKIKQQKLYKDSKSQLQELVQSKGLDAPHYEVINEVGPDHEKEFTIQVLIAGQIQGSGSGKSKQQAQQAAATVALEKFAAE